MKSLEVLSLFLSSESGQDMIEYALVAAMIGLGAVVSLKSLCGVVVGFFNRLSVMESYF